jgi:hypothetical protein
VEQTISIPTPAAPDFSIYGLVMHSDPVVKGVLVLLLLASVACWAIIIEKTFRLMVLKNQLRWLREAESGQGSPRSTKGLVRAILLAAAEEAKELHARDESRLELRARLEQAMRGALKTEFQRNRSRPSLSRHGRLGGSLCRPVRNRVGHRQQLHLDRPAEGHEPCRCRSWHR